MASLAPPKDNKVTDDLLHRSLDAVLSIQTHVLEKIAEISAKQDEFIKKLDDTNAKLHESTRILHMQMENLNRNVDNLVDLKTTQSRYPSSRFKC